MKLKRLIKASRHSQTSVGLAIGASQNAVGKWSRGESEPGITLAGKLALLFDVDLEYLAFDDVHEPRRSPAEREAIKIIRAIGYDEDEVVRRLGNPGVIRMDDVPKKSSELPPVVPEEPAADVPPNYTTEIREPHETVGEIKVSSDGPDVTPTAPGGNASPPRKARKTNGRSSG